MKIFYKTSLLLPDKVDVGGVFKHKETGENTLGKEA